MSDIKTLIGKKILIMDGAMGTLLMEKGIRPDESFDLQNIKNPEIVKSIHKRYVDAGADIIETNTFGANRIKLSDYKADDKVFEINSAAVKLAKEAADGDAFVCGSIGPLGKFIEPLGELSFDEAASTFAEQAIALEKSGADCLCVETISDLQEMRAAIIGIKASVSIPVIASLTYDENGLTVFGTPPEVAVIVLEALGADVISANCSTGPEGIIKISKRLLQKSSKPIMVMPNAGMPEIEGDRAVYKMPPKKFAAHAKKFAEMGVSIIGGCCGTTPDHIEEVRKAIPKGMSVKKQIHELKLKKSGREDVFEAKPASPTFASRSKPIEIVNKFMTVGEKINPTGRKLLREDIKTNSFSMIRDEAVKQTKADLLDVNVSVAEGNDPENMKKALKIIQNAVQNPVSIDSPNVAALEAGLKEFCGKALLNSVNGKEKSLKEILPLAKKYGAAIIGLTIDDEGIPTSAAQRIKIAKKIVKEALRAGIRKEDIFIDALVMTSATGITQPLETLKTLIEVKENLGVNTILGISNVSHGLPERGKINSIFLQLALHHGLDAAIVDVNDPHIKRALALFKFFKGNSKKEIKSLLKNFESEIEKTKKIGTKPQKQEKLKTLKYKGLKDIESSVIEGSLEKVKFLVSEGLKSGEDPQTIIDNALTKGMEIVGEKFSKKIFFLPQVIASANAMSEGFALCKEKIPKGKIKNIGKIILATVHGDIHDIGKNIVKMMLENQGFEVIDLGKDTPTNKIVEEAIKSKPNAIGLSALLTTTMLEMRTVKEKLKEAGLDIPIIIGGAVVTADFANKMEASYGEDAAQAVKLAKKIIESTKNGNS